MGFQPGEQIRCIDEIEPDLVDEEGSITVPVGAVVTVVDRPDLTEGWFEGDRELEMVAFEYDGHITHADSAFFARQVS